MMFLALKYRLVFVSVMILIIIWNCCAQRASSRIDNNSKRCLRYCSSAGMKYKGTVNQTISGKTRIGCGVLCLELRCAGYNFYAGAGAGAGAGVCELLMEDDIGCLENQSGVTAFSTKLCSG